VVIAGTLAVGCGKDSRAMMCSAFANCKCRDAVTLATRQAAQLPGRSRAASASHQSWAAAQGASVISTRISPDSIIF
jgi:hypothetical protein